MSSNDVRKEIAQHFADDVALTRAIRRAVRNAVLVHKQAGNPVAAWRDGKVILLAPDEIVLPEEEDAVQESSSRADHSAP